MGYSKASVRLWTGMPHPVNDRCLANQGQAKVSQCIYEITFRPMTSHLQSGGTIKPAPVDTMTLAPGFSPLPDD
jgi:hypothetical protein